VLVDPDHNLHYINGSAVWAGVMPMALIGISRAFGVDLSPYLSSYGQQVFSAMQSDSIAQVLGEYPGLTWSQIAKPQYPGPGQIPIFVKLAKQLIMDDHDCSMACGALRGCPGARELRPDRTRKSGRADRLRVVSWPL